MIFEYLTDLRDKIDDKLRKLVPPAAPPAKSKQFTPPASPVERLEIPDGTDYIPRAALEGHRELVSVSVPASVKFIGERAFAGCERLESVTLREGLEGIGANAFNGCKSLRSVVVPDSALDVNGMVFHNSGVETPVLSASGDKLFFCPARAAGEEFAVPEGVRRIVSRAFLELPSLRRVRFPGTLERIDTLAFVKCGMKSVSLPAGFRELGENAFFRCGDLRDIRFELEREDPVRAAVIKLHALGRSFLMPVKSEPPRDDPYWRGADFRALAEECVRGIGEAMERMVRFFEEKSKAAPEERFYTGAANFWRYRAFESSSEVQRRWLTDFVKASPGERLPSACLTEKLEGTERGSSLNALGFFFFDPDRVYSLAGLDGDGVVEVSAYESEDGPDEDGYGRETYFDWWYLDGDLRPVPGAGCLHSFSNIDRRISDVQNRFRTAHNTVAGAVALRNGKEHG